MPLVDVLSIPDGKRVNPSVAPVEFIDHTEIPRAEFEGVHTLQLLMRKSVEP